MSKRGIEFKVGLLLLGAIALVVGLVFVLGNFSLGPGYTLYVDYSFSGNIQPGAPVKLSGIKVGKVEEVSLMPGEVDPATGRRVQVRLEVWLEDRVKDSIRQDAEFYVNTAGVLGEQYLEIVPGQNFDDPPLSPGAVVRGVDPPRTDLIVSRLYVVLDSLSRVLTEERDAIGNLLRSGAGAVTELESLLADNSAELSKLITATTNLASEASVSLEKINDGIGDPALIGRTVRHADQLLVTAEGSLREVTPEMRALIGDARRVTGLVTAERVDRTIGVAEKAVVVTGRAGKLIANVDALVSDIRAGKGTVGALLVRSEIYADLREMIRDLKRNPWKFFWKE